MLRIYLLLVIDGGKLCDSLSLMCIMSVGGRHICSHVTSALMTDIFSSLHVRYDQQ